MYKRFLPYLCDAVNGRSYSILQITNSYKIVQANNNHDPLQHHNLLFNIISLKYTSCITQDSLTASYEEIKKLGKQPSKDVYIIDVREPTELQETGTIPSSLNIPCLSIFWFGCDADRMDRPLHLHNICHICRQCFAFNTPSG
ncbi:unnamed protein product [Acanthoscelides obtectus]|uniref:Rhodanese domain-containing protein n=1 Tax=Acanthoscelides obtectus TaxID=200917 RepID=A0A9P0MBS5_ACAOB|nr:unnamed protein product [Acanthoscelides obtectus]CAK1677398.1 Rhodanese domain-containing protein CG4456 [Acanthoscelides obtectus]